MSLYNKLLAERNITKKTKTKHSEENVSYWIKSVLLRYTKNSFIFLNIDKGQSVRVLTDNNIDIETLPLIFSANCRTKDISKLPLLPGITLQIRIGIKTGRLGQIIKVELYEIKDISYIDTDVFDNKSYLFQYPESSKNFRRQDILIPMTAYYRSDIEDGSLDGYLTERPNTSTINDRFCFNREYIIESIQWKNTSNPMHENKLFKAVIRFPLSALACFGVTNETHWRDNDYANKWLLHTDYVLNTSVSAKSHSFIISKDFMPRTIFTTVIHVYVNLAKQIRMIGVQVKPDEVETLLLDKGHKKYANKTDSAVINVTECQDHIVNHEKYVYYKVGSKGCWDLFALKI